MRPRCFLVVGRAVGAYVPLILEPYGTVLLAASVEEAARAMVEKRATLTTIIADVDLADGSGFDVPERMSVLDMEIPGLVVTPHRDRVRAEQLTRAGRMLWLCWEGPLTGQVIASLVEDWDRMATEDEEEDERFVHRFAAESGMSTEQVRADIRGLLRKTGARTLQEAKRRVEREATELEEREDRAGGATKPPTLN